MPGSGGLMAKAPGDSTRASYLPGGGGWLGVCGRWDERSGVRGVRDQERGQAAAGEQRTCSSSALKHMPRPPADSTQGGSSSVRQGSALVLLLAARPPRRDGAGRTVNRHHLQGRVRAGSLLVLLGAAGPGHPPAPCNGRHLMGSQASEGGAPRPLPPLWAHSIPNKITSVFSRMFTLNHVLNLAAEATSRLFSSCAAAPGAARRRGCAWARARGGSRRAQNTPQHPPG